MSRDHIWWRNLAIDTANYACRYWFESRIGCLAITEDAVGIYGNTGYCQSVYAREQVDYLRQRVGAAGITELGFGIDTLAPDTTDNGYTWALLIDTGNLKLAEALVREASVYTSLHQL